MKNLISLLLLFSFFLYSCTEEESLTDATGVFEATEIIVSAESNGKILVLHVNEGDELDQDQTVGLIDSTQLHFSKMHLEATKITVEANRPDISAQIEATEREISKLESEKKRIQKLLDGDVATQKQMDDIESAILVLKARLRSQKSSLSNSVKAIDAQSNSIDVQLAQLDDKIAKCNIQSPIDGTVLVKYAEQGEMTATGKALFKIADIDNMILKAYVTADQLVQIKVGQQVNVLAEFGEEDNRTYIGTITWIASKSEFTPKTIQTQDERANLVYAAKIAVPNDGYLKIGMYGGFKVTD
jgi:HlyD family secretion protein